MHDQKVFIYIFSVGCKDVKIEVFIHRASVMLLNWYYNLLEQGFDCFLIGILNVAETLKSQ